MTAMPLHVFSRIAVELRMLLRPLLRCADDPIRFARLLRRMGWAVPNLAKLSLDSLFAAMTELEQTATGLIERDLSRADLAELATAGSELAQVLGSLDELVPILQAGFEGRLSAELGRTLVEDLGHLLMLDYLDERAPELLALLRVLTIVETETLPAIRVGEWTARRKLRRETLSTARLAALVRDPTGTLRDAYLPGGSLDSQAEAIAFVEVMFGRLRPLVQAGGGDVWVGLENAPPAATADASRAAQARSASIKLPLPIPPSALDAALWATLEVVPAGSKSRAGRAGPGLEIEPVGVIACAGSLGAWTLALTITGELGSMFIGDDRFVGPKGAGLRLDAALARGGAGAPALVLGASAGTRLELGVVELTGFGDFAPSSVDFGFGATARDCKLVVAGGEGDSFLAEMLGEGVELEFDLGLAWSKRGGLSLSGGAGLATTIPIGLNLGGVVMVDALELALVVDAEHLALRAGASVEIAIGPFTALVEGVGIAVEGVFLPAPTGNLGAIDLRLAFEPPTGIGLAIDASIAKGGGFLAFGDHRYAGVLELELLEVGVTAAGVLVTRMPEGSEGWSLLLSLAAQFPGIQLGFGFTLLGLGGLIGIHRSVDLDALSEGVRTGALAHLLFPDDPIGEADELIAALEGVFPIAKDQYVFGPVAKLGWGTPTLLTLELGLIMQLPEPLTISLLGSFEALLPSRELALLALRVDMAGSLDFAAGTLRIDAALRDSKIVGLTLTGAMAVRASFLTNPSFLIAFGGFHPAFNPPAEFPKLDRLAVSLDGGDEVRVRLAGYFALTSNTVQFGAEASFYAKRTGFVAEGGTSFDALFQFSPFSFTVGLRAWLTVSAGELELLGVDLDATLRGPSPWHVTGRASFKLLGLRTHLEIEARIGQSNSQPAPARVDVLGQVAAALASGEAWASLAPRGRACVRLLDPPESSVLALHPAGRVSLRQRVAPLGVTLERFGEAEITGPTKLTLSKPTLAGQALACETLDDQFAAAHYFDMTKTERLAAPSFEPMQAGVILGDERHDASEANPFTFDYETHYVDGHDARPSPGRAVLPFALARARVRASQAKPREQGSSRFGVVAPTYEIRDANTGATLPGSPADAGWFDARAALRERSASLAGARILAPSWEKP